MNNIRPMAGYVGQQAVTELLDQLALHFFTTRGPLSWRGKMCRALHESVSADLKRPELAYDGEECHDIGNAAEARKDYPSALQWYRKGADLGHANCKNSVGVYLLAGRGAARDKREAAHCFLGAVQSGLRGGTITRNLLLAARALSNAPDLADRDIARACLETAIRIGKRRKALAEARALLASLPEPSAPLAVAAPVALKAA